MGFTLVEVLVVIAIIALLGAIAYPVIRSIQASSKVKAAKARIESLKLALGTYSAEGDYPPTWTGRGGNGVNEGNESLLRALRATRRDTHFEAKEDEVADTDRDKLQELVDPWGNPFIYFHNADLSSSPAEKLAVYYLAGQDGAGGPGNRIKVKPRKDPKSGEFPGATTDIIWSTGPDGLNEDGAGDDIASWH